MCCNSDGLIKYDFCVRVICTSHLKWSRKAELETIVIRDEDNLMMKQEICLSCPMHVKKYHRSVCYFLVLF